MLNVLSRDEKSLCLQLESVRDTVRERERGRGRGNWPGIERGNVLSRVVWSVLAASKEEAKRKVEKWLARPFCVAPRR